MEISILIKRAILRQKLFFAADLDDFYSFLSSKAGGIEGLRWKEFVLFHKTFVTPSLRTMPRDIFRALADFPSIRTTYAILKAAYTCPNNQIVARQCTWIKRAEVASLGGAKK